MNTRLVARAPSVLGQTVQVAGMVWYSSAAPAASLRWGPFDVHATPATPGQHPLVLVSHGTGGHERAHAWLAERLATAGDVVLSLRHAGDNFEDRSAVARPDYFHERPRQVSRGLDQFLAQPARAALVDPQRIAAVGHSAGGDTELALASARPDRARVQAHCSAQGEGLVADALAQVTVPVRISFGSADEVLAPRCHGQALCHALPQARCERSEGAGHFALFQAGTGPMGSAAGDAAADPPGSEPAQRKPMEIQGTKATTSVPSSSANR
jgi:predicted dienelactone hydrolase